jgi:cutinase
MISSAIRSITFLTLLISLLQTLSAFPLDVRQSLPTTENGLSGACKAVAVIFARGTNEAGNVGDIAGPPWFSKLRSSLGTSLITVQGVTYAANTAGYLAGGDAAGSTEMLRLINLAASKCPSTKIVLGGYR